MSRISILHRLHNGIPSLNKRILIVAAFACIASWAASTTLNAIVISPVSRYPVLGKCSGRETGIFMNVASQTNPAIGLSAVEQWSTLYHGTVDQVVTEYVGTIEIDPSTIDCLADNTDILELPPPQMVALASQLPPWQDAAELITLKRSDIGAVLQEYLRVYECSLAERQVSISSEVYEDIWRYVDLQPGGREDNPVKWWDVGDGSQFSQRLIDHEMAISRTTLDRTLTVTANLDRFRGLRINAICLQRASLEARNGFALAAESAACFPRTFYPQDILRDYDQFNES